MRHDCPNSAPTMNTHSPRDFIVLTSPDRGNDGCGPQPFPSLEVYNYILCMLPSPSTLSFPLQNHYTLTPPEPCENWNVNLVHMTYGRLDSVIVLIYEEVFYFGYNIQNDQTENHHSLLNPVINNFKKKTKRKKLSTTVTTRRTNEIRPQKGKSRRTYTINPYMIREATTSDRDCCQHQRTFSASFAWRLFYLCDEMPL